MTSVLAEILQVAKYIERVAARIGKGDELGIYHISSCTEPWATQKGYAEKNWTCTLATLRLQKLRYQEIPKQYPSNCVT